MPAEVVSSKIVAIRVVSALVIILLLLWLFSTSLFIPIRIYREIYLGNIIVAVIAFIFALKAEELASPLSNEVSLRFKLNSQKIGGTLKWGLRLISLAVLYVGLHGVLFQILTWYFEHSVSSTIYNAVFVVTGSVIVYQVVKAITS
jgi:membrane protease YdiL (CAAX protease family)